MTRLLTVALAIALGSCALSGCSLATRAGIGLFYEKADLPGSQIARDVCYVAAAPCETRPQRRLLSSSCASSAVDATAVACAMIRLWTAS